MGGTPPGSLARPSLQVRRKWRINSPIRNLRDANCEVSRVVSGTREMANTLPLPISQFHFGSYTVNTLEALAKSFSEGKPFPHVIIDDFIAVDDQEVCAAFPTPDWAFWDRFDDGYQFQKRHCSEIVRMPVLYRNMIHELSGPAFLRILETITGIRGLLPDPYLYGGGLHLSGPGGILAPHVDFTSLGPLALYRRLNLLIYFNSEWAEEYGGCLELYEKGRKEPVATIVPSFGRCILFRTDNQSIHGFSRPIIGENRWRKSLALYYYTSEGDNEIILDGVTYWQKHGHMSRGRLIQFLAYKMLIRGSQLLSEYAHKINPNFRAGSKPVTFGER